MRVTKEDIIRAAELLAAEVDRRDEWYGIDNWQFEEVVRLVADAYDRGFADGRAECSCGPWS